MTDVARVGVPTFELRHRLARSLEYAGMRVAEMAEYLGVSLTTMSNYLSGRTTPRTGTIRAWALRTGVAYDWLVSGLESGPDQPPSASARRRSPAAVHLRPIAA